MSRLRAVLTALDEHIEPKVIDRLGVRYIDRIVGQAVDDIGNLVRPEVRGITGTPVDSRVLNALTQSLFEINDERMLARWGRIPAGETFDPAAIEPSNERSWVLDLDMFTVGPMPFSVARVVDDATRFAERIYTFFRWAVTDDFLRRYGGRV